MTWAHLDLKAGSVPLIDPTSPNVNPETRPRIDGKAEIIPPSTPSNIDPTTNVGASIEISTGSDSHPDEESTLYQLLFDFKSFLEGGDLDDVFGITPGYTSEGGKWEIAKLSGGFMNVTVRVLPPHGDDKNPRSVVIKYAPPFMAAMGQDAPFGTFRQVGTVLRSHHQLPSPRYRYPHTTSGSTLHPFVLSQDTNIRRTDVRLSNTGPWICLGPHPASHPLRPRTGLRSQEPSSSSRMKACW